MFLGGPDKLDSGLLDPAGLDGLVTGSAWTSFAPTNVYRVGGNAILWPQGAPGDTRVTLLGGYTYSGAGRRRGGRHRDVRHRRRRPPAGRSTARASRP